MQQDVRGVGFERRGSAYIALLARLAVLYANCHRLFRLPPPPLCSFPASFRDTLLSRDDSTTSVSLEVAYDSDEGDIRADSAARACTNRSVPTLQQQDDDSIVETSHASTSALRMTPAIAQTPLLSGADRARLAADHQESSLRRGVRSSASAGAEDPSRPSHRSNTSAALQGIGKAPAAHGKTGSWASRLSLDWTRRDPSRSGSTSFLPLGLFSSFAAQEGGAGTTNNRYEPVAPMEAAARKRQKSIFELDMGDFSEGLRLSTAREGDEDDDERDHEERQRLYHQAQQRHSAEDRRRRKRRKSSGAIGAFVSFLFSGASLSG